MPDTEVITFGCRLNAFESERIRRAAAVAGLGNAVIVNTCAVTAEAERQARQAIRRARRQHPTARIIVTGCAAEIAPESYAALPEVDRVLGNEAKLRPESYLPALAAGANHACGILTRRPPDYDPGVGTPPRAAGEGGPGPHGSARSAARGQAPGWVGEGGKSRAYLQVQQGCDHRCTFCIIPYGRGPSRSVPTEIIINEAQRLINAGCREIVLTGVDLTAYGTDLPGRPSLGQMVRRLLAELPEIGRLRLSSLDPAEIDTELWHLIAEEKRLMPHLHLSLQSGDDLILKRMRRRHSRALAIAVAKQARALRPEVALGADLIAGFPTETEDGFLRSLDLIAECGLAYVHVFPYSARPGTPAARMPQLPHSIVKERARRLRSTAEAALAAELLSRVGGETDVLVERPGTGRAEFYAVVAFESPEMPGAVRRMRIVGNSAGSLLGVPVQ